MSLIAQRRAFRRFVRLPCEVIREHDFRVVGTLAVDLSTRGMLVRAQPRKNVLTGEEVVVAFQTKDNRWFDAMGTVARVLHGRRPTDDGVCLGVEFHAVAPELASLLFEHLRGKDPTEPLRPRRVLAA
jgi:hypothetical protein